MNQPSNPSDSFNARNLTPEQVARTFVPPAEFTSLVQPTSAIVVGPRGSGKTTLLKMLQQEALEAWEHSDAERVAGSMSYSTAFIATDRRWSTQLENLGEGALDPATAARFAIAAYTTQVLRAVVNTMLARVQVPGAGTLRSVGSVDLSPRQEVELASELGATWLVKLRMGSLLALRQSLTQRLVEIRWLATREAELGASGREARLGERPFLYIPFLDASVSGIERFNDLTRQRHRRWALAFDELELAPVPILHELASAIRASDEHILFKLALSPARQFGADLKSALAASPGHDYSEIRLWYPDRRDGEAFCRDLWSAMLLRRGLPALDPHDVLGPSYFEPRPGPTGHDYEPGSKWAELFNRMAENDRTFRDYLTKKKIDPERLHTMRDRDRAADVRKIAPLLPLREFFRHADRDSPSLGRRRSRKSPTLYTGAATLFAVTEANPRWFKNLFDPLLDRMAGGKIDASTQAEAVSATAQRFAALLKTVPAPTIVHRGTPRGVLGVVKEIGAHIRDDHVVAAFKPEPLATFAVHSDAPVNLLEILEEAVNWGAIIYVPDQVAQSLIGSVRGKRFRISYLLAPLYGLPVRLGKPLSLKTVFSRRAASAPPSLPFPEDRDDLVDSPEDLTSL